jgi:hypothetical protein
MKNMNIPADFQIDEVYDVIDTLMKIGNWKLMDIYFDRWIHEVNCVHLDILLARSTASLPVKTKLQRRSVFIERCKKTHPNPTLWKGLE